MKIVLEHLTKKFPARGKKGEEVTAVRDFTFEIPDGYAGRAAGAVRAAESPPR